MALEADAARFLAAHQDLALKHEVDDIFEADAVLDELAAVLQADAVEHFGGVEGAGDGAGPVLVLQNPTEQHGVDFVGVDEVTKLVCRPDAVGVAVRAESGLAAVGNRGFAEGANVRLDGFGIDSGKERIGVGANLDVGHAERREDIGEDGAAGAVHGVDAELHAGFGDEVEIGEALDGFEIGGQEVDFRNRRGLRRAGNGLAEIGLDGGNHGGLARAAVPALVLDAVPLRGIVRGGDHDAAGCAALAHAKAERGGGRDGVGEHDGNAGGGDDLGAGMGEGFGPEARVVANAEASGGVYMFEDVGGDGLGGDAHVGEGEVVGDDAAPAVGAELDDGVRHGACGLLAKQRTTITGGEGLAHGGPERTHDVGCSGKAMQLANSS